MMPEMDGFQFLEMPPAEGTATPGRHGNRLFHGGECRALLVTAGAIDFIPKPFTADELLSAVRRGTPLPANSATAGRPGAAEELTRHTVLRPVPAEVLPARVHELGVARARRERRSLGVTAPFPARRSNTRGVRSCSRPDDEIVQGTVCASVQTLDGADSTPCSAPLSGSDRRVQHSTGRRSLVDRKGSRISKDGCTGSSHPNVEYELAHLIPCSSDRPF